MDIKVREYNENDYEIVKKIIKDNFDDDKVESKKLDNITEFVATIDNIPVGYFVLTKNYNIVRGFYYYLIDYVCTDIDHQGMGIGKTMMSYIVDKVNNEDVKYAQLTCSNKRGCARHIYEKYGFKLYDTNVFRLVK